MMKGAEERGYFFEVSFYRVLEASMQRQTIPALMFFLALSVNGCNPVKKQPVDDNNIKILDEHVIAMAKSLGKDQKSYRMHIRTDVDGAKIYRQVGRYIIVDSGGEVIYVPDRI